MVSAELEVDFCCFLSLYRRGNKWNIWSRSQNSNNRLGIIIYKVILLMELNEIISRIKFDSSNQKSRDFLTGCLYRSQPGYKQQKNSCLFVDVSGKIKKVLKCLKNYSGPTLRKCLCRSSSDEQLMLNQCSVSIKWNSAFLKPLLEPRRAT